MFWLIVFVFSHGHYDHKIERQFNTRAACEATQYRVTRDPNKMAVCVTDGHKRGISQDRNIPYDYD